MVLFVAFLLGVGNFAMHRAVLESGHPLIGQMPWFFHLLNGRMGLVIEFLMLTATLLMVSQGSTGWLIGYALYSAANGFAAWLILANRI